MSDSKIDIVRSFNREVTRRIGALEDNFLRRGRPIALARLIHEIGEEGTTAKNLRRKLGLDSGYLSRLITSLEEERVILTRRPASDRRTKAIRLSAKGKRELSAYNSISDELAHALLKSLSPRQQNQLCNAMAEVEKLLTAGAVSYAIEKPDSDDARWCFHQYFEELNKRFDGGFNVYDSLPTDDLEISPPNGALILARLDGAPIACGALKIARETIGDIKRMWTAPHARGMGVARRILESLEQQAQMLSLTQLRLETNGSLKEAQALYRSTGFIEVPAFNDEPYAHHWFQKEL